MLSIAIVNLKGGVGKTSVAINLAAALNFLGKRILLVDFDPNHDLTENLGINPYTIIGVEYFIIGASKFNSVKKEYCPKFDFIPSGIKLKDLELSLNGNPANRSNRFFQVKNAFQNIPDLYDFIIFDCPPFGGNLTVNALVHVQKIIIPVQCQYLGLKGAKRTLVLFKKVKNLYNPKLEVAAILATLYEKKNGLAGLVLKQILRTFKDQVSPTVIHTSISLAEAPRYKKTIFDYAPKSTSCQDFLRLANEMVLKETWQTKELNIEVNTDLKI